MKRSKKVLKEKILQQTNITGNTKQQKVEIAEFVIKNAAYKQDLCNEHAGLDINFIDKVMKEVLRNNKGRDEDIEKDLLEEIQEEDFPSPPPRKKRPIAAGDYTPEDAAFLVKEMGAKQKV
jgi:hypothetical protein